MEHTLINQKEFILDYSKQKLATLGTLTDFTEVFNPIDHRTMDHKLENYVTSAVP